MVEVQTHRSSSGFQPVGDGCAPALDSAGVSKPPVLRIPAASTSGSPSLLLGGLSVENATLNRFLSLHYLLPFIIAGNSVVHLAALHEVGSNHPLVGANPVDKSAFFTDSLIKDLVG